MTDFPATQISHFSSVYKEMSVRTAHCSGRLVGVRSQIKRPNLSPGSQLRNQLRLVLSRVRGRNISSHWRCSERGGGSGIYSESLDVIFVVVVVCFV